MYIIVFVFHLVLLSIPYSWLPTSLFLLDTGSFLWTTTSCRTCHRTFLPGFHGLGECVVFLVAEYWDTVLEWKCWFSIIFWRVFACVSIVAFVCVCFVVSRRAPAAKQTHSAEISEIVPAHARAHTHAEITSAPLSCGGDECDADSLLLLRHNKYTDTQVCMFVCLLFWVYVTSGCQSCIPTCILVCLRMYIFVLFFIVLSEYTLQLVA
jgi:hypothetical protein